LFRPKHNIPGTDFTGEVTQCGSNVTAYKVGDRVWGFNDDGLQSHAEFICIKEKEAMAHIPDGRSYEEAVTAAEGGSLCHKLH